MTPSGIEPATFWLEKQFLNYPLHRVPYIFTDCLIFFPERIENRYKNFQVWCLVSERELNLFPAEYDFQDITEPTC
jgi:hypothetical protein